MDTSELPSARYSTRLPCPGAPRPERFDSLPILTRPQIAAKIAAGQLLVLHTLLEGKEALVYRIPLAWLNSHPGGDLAILHYVGRDASNEIEGYHTGRTVAVRMARWIVGRVELGEDGWRDMVPPVQLSMWPIPVPKITLTLPCDKVKDQVAVEVKEPLSKSGEAEGSWLLNPSMVDPPCVPYDQLPLTPSYQHHLRQSLRSLHVRIQSLGLDTPPPFLSGYGPSLFIYIGLALLSAYLYFRARTTLDYVLAAVALGLFWHQVTFVAHDAGHSGLTGDWHGDRIRGLLIANFMGGMSIGWWADNHNVHHCEFSRCFARFRADLSSFRSGDQLA